MAAKKLTPEQQAEKDAEEARSAAVAARLAEQEAEQEADRAANAAVAEAATAELRSKRVAVYVDKLTGSGKLPAISKLEPAGAQVVIVVLERDDEPGLRTIDHAANVLIEIAQLKRAEAEIGFDVLGLDE